MNQVRVRFAPSPTGRLHIGGLRTALFNYLFARKNNGKMILRIEDTDRKRTVPGAVDNICNMMKWAGIHIDEGVSSDQQPFGPYVQSERLHMYKSHADQLVQENKAYKCFCTEERLQLMRKAQQKKGTISAMYDKTCKKLPSEEVEKLVEAGTPYTIRMAVPEDGGATTVHDETLGEIQFSNDTIDDQVILKSDGFPTYHLANVVDDHYMQISHVIRGEEWLPSTPKHVLLYDSFGWEIPKFVHLPLLLNSNRSKLSKREGDVSVEDFYNKGYLPTALCNFIALLGWNPGSGDTQELFTSNDELLEKFELDDVNKGGAIVDIKKLNFINRHHIENITLNGTKEERQFLREQVLPYIDDQISQSKMLNVTDEKYLDGIITLLLDRIETLSDYAKHCKYFFEDPFDNTNKNDMLNIENNTELDKKIKSIQEWETEWKNLVIDTFNNINDNSWNDENIKQAIASVIKSYNNEMAGEGKRKLKQVDILKPLRFYCTGEYMGPPITEILELLGKDVVLNRLNV